MRVKWAAGLDLDHRIMIRRLGSHASAGRRRWPSNGGGRRRRAAAGGGTAQGIEVEGARPRARAVPG
jgi:hypothetical protein